MTRSSSPIRSPAWGSVCRSNRLALSQSHLRVVSGLRLDQPNTFSTYHICRCIWTVDPPPRGPVRSLSSPFGHRAAGGRLRPAMGSEEPARPGAVGSWTPPPGPKRLRPGCRVSPRLLRADRPAWRAAVRQRSPFPYAFSASAYSWRGNVSPLGTRIISVNISRRLPSGSRK